MSRNTFGVELLSFMFIAASLEAFSFTRLFVCSDTKTCLLRVEALLVLSPVVVLLLLLLLK